ncbi:aldehyde dehydrogenase family protein [Hoyosella subflava]|uniref:Aldehyde dehydrogenase n=1 Tax=Hoyosella subflava (strain DSM 45089 / JCM 17490 / NBRC 109087 / DQS3-9A1) TaxID=443218 RepID=F6EI81_HOYSD|nr:aldehyde dehydrogenase family protein [Hoyosella subflava]AEF41188.1 Aldehyde dehydrogenase [Hoyosella subflava DQS3-9A1]
MSNPVELRNNIGGQWVPGVGDEIVSTSPAEPDVVVARGRQADLAQADAAIEAAQHAKQAWAATPAHERGAILVRAATIVEASATEWGSELAREEGKTRAEGIGEVQRAAQILRYYGNDADREAGEMYSSPRRGERIIVTRKPIGVVAVVTPFNFPIAIPAWKIAPALTYGNTVVWKPASTVPLLAMRFAEALIQAGLPDGVLNLLMGGSAIGNAMVSHNGVDAITFTGSTGVGRKLAVAAAARGVPIQAEMGGKNAAIVLGDADLDLAAEQVLLGAFRSTGQKCTATSRLIVTSDIADDFIAELAKRASALRVGNPVEDGVEMGPVVDGAARDSINAGIEQAIAQGAERISGETYTSGALAAGYYVAPTILALSSGEPDIWRDELFGPVLAARKASTVEEAFALANDSEFGLSAAIFTQDLTRTLEAMAALDVGMLHVNSETAGADPHVPFGGAKKSGYGPKEQGQAAREFFTHTTTVYLRGGEART